MGRPVFMLRAAHAFALRFDARLYELLGLS